MEALTERVIGAAIAVHTELGPGFLETVYEKALAVEFTERGIHYERQKPLAELKAISALEGIHFAILRSYLKAAGLDMALLLNFASAPLTVKRVGRHFTGGKSRLDLHV